MDPVSAFGIATGGIQLIDFGISTIPKIFKLFKEIKSAPERLRQLFDDLGASKQLLERLQDELNKTDSPLNPELKENPEKLGLAAGGAINDLNDTLESAISTKRNKIWRAIISHQTEEKIEKDLGRISQLCQEVMLNLQLAGLHLTENHLSALHSVSQRVEAFQTQEDDHFKKTKILTSEILSEVKGSSTQLRLIQQNSEKNGEAVSSIQSFTTENTQSTRMVLESQTRIERSIQQLINQNNVTTASSQKAVTTVSYDDHEILYSPYQKPSGLEGSLGSSTRTPAFINQLYCACGPGSSHSASFLRFGRFGIRQTKQSKHRPTCPFHQKHWSCEIYVQLLPFMQKTISLDFQYAFNAMKSYETFITPALRCYYTVDSTTDPFSVLLRTNCSEPLNDTFKDSLLQLLQENKFSPNARNLQGQTYLHQLCADWKFAWLSSPEQSQIFIEVLEILTRNGVQFDALDRHNKLAIDYYIAHRRYCVQHINDKIKAEGFLLQSTLRSDAEIFINIDPFIYSAASCHWSQDKISVGLFCYLLEDRFQPPKTCNERYRDAVSLFYSAIGKRSIAALEDSLDLLNDASSAESGFQRDISHALCFVLTWGAGLDLMLLKGANPLAALYYIMNGISKTLGRYWHIYKYGFEKLVSTCDFSKPFDGYGLSALTGDMVECFIYEARQIFVNGIKARRTQLMNLGVQHLPLGLQQELTLWKKPEQDHFALAVYCALKAAGVSVPAVCRPGDMENVYSHYRKKPDPTNSRRHLSWFNRSDFFELALEAGFALPPWILDHEALLPNFISNHFYSTRSFQTVLLLLQVGAKTTFFDSELFPNALFYICCKGWELYSPEPPDPYILQILTRTGESCSPLERDACVCYCSSNGCTCWNKLWTGPSKNYARNTYELCKILNSYMIRMGIESGHVRQRIRREVSRKELFQRLGMKHTCCYLHSSGARIRICSDVEREEILDGQEELNDQLETLLKVYDSMLQKLECHSKDVWASWWELVDKILPDLTTDQKILANRGTSCVYMYLSVPPKEVEQTRDAMEVEALEKEGYSGWDFIDVIYDYFRDYLPPRKTNGLQKSEPRPRGIGLLEKRNIRAASSSEMVGIERPVEEKASASPLLAPSAPGVHRRISRRQSI